MKQIRMMLLIIAFAVLAANTAFAGLSYEVTVDTTSLSGQNGYLYFQYLPVNAIDSTAAVTGFYGGTLASSRAAEVDGSAVSGVLPGPVTFANTNGINDYNQGITFGNQMRFFVTLNGTPGGANGGSSTFSLGLFSDELGFNPLLTTDGMLYTISFMNDGTATTDILALQAAVNPVPLPGAVWLLGSGLAGLIAARKRLAA